MAVDAALRQRILETYPAFGWLVDVPEVGDLLARASTEGWDLGRLQANLYATDWWKTRSEAVRQAETLAATDPAQYRAVINTKAADITALSNELGIVLNENEIWFIANTMANQGLEASGDQQRLALMNWARANRGRISTHGSIYAQMQRADQIARQEFFWVPSYEQISDFGINAAFGYSNEDALRQSYAEVFAAMFPHLGSRLQGGETLAQIINPFRDVIAKELELGGVEGVDMVSSNEWKWLLGMPDPTSGEVRLPTQQEVIERARKDARWKSTVGATALTTNLADGITKAMGARA